MVHLNPYAPLASAADLVSPLPPLAAEPYLAWPVLGRTKEQICCWNDQWSWTASTNRFAEVWCTFKYAVVQAMLSHYTIKQEMQVWHSLCQQTNLRSSDNIWHFSRGHVSTNVCQVQHCHWVLLHQTWHTVYETYVRSRALTTGWLANRAGLLSGM